MPAPYCDLNKCNDGTMAIGCVPHVVQMIRNVHTTFCSWGSGSYFLENVVPPIDAIKCHTGGSAVVTSSLSNNINAAVAAAKGKDVAMVFANA